MQPSITAASNSSCGILRKKTERMRTVKGSALIACTRMMRELRADQPGRLHHHVDRRDQRDRRHERAEDQEHEGEALSREERSARRRRRRACRATRLISERGERDLRAVPEAARRLPGGVGDHRAVGAGLQVGRRQLAGEDEAIVLQRHLVEEAAVAREHHAVGNDAAGEGEHDRPGGEEQDEERADRGAGCRCYALASSRILEEVGGQAPW